MQRGQETLYLTPRLGFVKLAMTHGVPLVPAFAFGVRLGCMCTVHTQRLRLYASLSLSLSLSSAAGSVHACMQRGGPRAPQQSSR